MSCLFPGAEPEALWILGACALLVVGCVCATFYQIGVAAGMRQTRRIFGRYSGGAL